MTAPAEKGFGHTVIERMIGQALKATIDLRYEPDGVVWSVDTELAAVSQLDNAFAESELATI